MVAEVVAARIPSGIARVREAPAPRAPRADARHAAAAFPARRAARRARARRRRGARPTALPARARGALQPRAALPCRPPPRPGWRRRACEPALAECDFGGWAGALAWSDVDDAGRAGAWMTDPAARPARRRVAARVRGARRGLARRAGARSTARAVAITHGGVVKAAVVHALGAPLDAFWRIDVAPLSITELHAHDGRWTVDARELACRSASAIRSLLDTLASRSGVRGARRRLRGRRRASATRGAGIRSPGFGNVALAVERATYAPTRLRGALYAAGLVGRRGAGRRAARARRGSGRLGRGVALAAVTWAALGGRSLVARGAAARDAASSSATSTARARRCRRCAAATRRPRRGAALPRARSSRSPRTPSDAVVGALVWGAIAGPAGVAAYRAANTLDAMVGHRSERYASFGWAAARLDDAHELARRARLAAALTALCAPVVGGSPRDGLAHRCAPTARAHPSPNAGRVEAAFAGALGVRLGGPLTYGGVAELRPTLGDGPRAGQRSTSTARRGCRCAVGDRGGDACAARAASCRRARPRVAR